MYQTIRLAADLADLAEGPTACSTQSVGKPSGTRQAGEVPMSSRTSYASAGSAGGGIRGSWVTTALIGETGKSEPDLAGSGRYWGVSNGRGEAVGGGDGAQQQRAAARDLSRRCGQARSVNTRRVAATTRPFSLAGGCAQRNPRYKASLQHRRGTPIIPPSTT